MIPLDTDYLCAFGFSEPFYDEAAVWLEGGEGRRLAFVTSEKIEDPLLLIDGRIERYDLESPLQIEGLAKKIGWRAVFRKLFVLLIVDSAEGKLFKSIAEECHLAAGLILSEAADFDTAILQNARTNQHPFRKGLDLKGVFSKVPALIVGGGPSLLKNRDLMSQFENKGLIFAGGTALNAIDVEPHFAASIDKDAPFQQFKKHPFAETPVCYQSRMNREIFSLIHSERLLFPDSYSYALNWLQGEESLFDGGWTVSNFLTAIALIFGCDPIIFIGMDLCYEEGQKYGGVDSILAEELIQVGEYWTKRDWLMSARWTEEMTTKHPDRSFINATEGGMGFGSPIRTGLLSDLLKDLPDWERGRQKVWDAIQQLPLHSGINQWRDWDLSLERCLGGGNREDEIVYEKLLMPLWNIWSPIFEREIGPHDLGKNKKMEIHQALFFEQVLQEHTNG